MRKNRPWFELFRTIFVRGGLIFFYRTRKAIGTENLPKDKPILFVPNHQNSFMDALHVVTKCTHVINFLTRAEAFQSSFMDNFLRSLNMIPVYRVRDGLKNVQKNENTFDRCYELLQMGESVLIFPEANHDLKRRVRPFSKGFTRIAFGAEEEYDWNLDLQIIPVGVNYDRHRKARTDICVAYGKPIPMSKYKKVYLQDARKATLQLKTECRSALQKLTMHMNAVDNYPFYHFLLDLAEPDRIKLIDPNIVNERVKVAEDHFDEQLNEEAAEILERAEKNNLDLHEFALPARLRWKDFILSPFYIFSWLNNIIPYQPIRYLISNVIKDRAFDASIKFAASLVTFIGWYTIIAIALILFGTDTTLVFAYLVLSIVTAPMIVRVHDLWRNIVGNDYMKKHKDFQKKFDEILNRFRELNKDLFSE